ncbi:MAG TPA: glutamyl-tRNA reductase [Acidimicrobiales bacterium]|nr:glutamyl-tRNA reductase [Acidimicrobiales bacterium]
MPVLILGLNHRTAPLHILERVTVSGDEIEKSLDDLMSRPNITEAVLVSTCNRIEIYVRAERFHGAYEDLRSHLCERSFLTPTELVDHLYVHHDDEVARHLFSVASGLDSAVLGETEILGQVKTAWERARTAGTAGPVLNLMFRHALMTGKRARTETAISRKITSVSQAAVALASRRLDGLAGRRVLVLGAGDMAEGMIRLLGELQLESVHIANRTPAKAEALAELAGGIPVELDDLVDELAHVDVLLTSTGANSLMLDHGDIASVVGRRDGHPLLVIDVAVPRDVDPAVAELDGVTLLDMEDIGAFAREGREGRRREVAHVETIIDEEVRHFAELRSARAADPLITSLRAEGEAIRLHELDRFRGRLANLEPAEREAVEALTHGLVAKLLHEPTTVLKKNAGSPKGDRLANAIRDLFDL